MKILAICGSPRKGNTYAALQNIKDIFSDIHIEILLLKDLDFEFCRGCYACVTHGSCKCPINDDRDRILEKIDEADGLIVASPVYSQMVPALMKNFFDRLGYIGHRPRFFNQFAMSLVTYSGYGAEPALEYMSKGLSVFGFNIVPSLALQYRPGGNTESLQQENIRKSIEAFEVFLNRIRSGEKDKPTLNKLVPFGIFKAISTKAKEAMPADFEYYKSKTDYFYDVKLPFHTKWITKKVVQKELSKIFGSADSQSFSIRRKK